MESMSWPLTPKSHSLISPRELTRMLEGLTSMWRGTQKTFTPCFQRHDFILEYTTSMLDGVHLNLCNSYYGGKVHLGGSRLNKEQERERQQGCADICMCEHIYLYVHTHVYIYAFQFVGLSNSWGLFRGLK